MYFCHQLQFEQNWTPQFRFPMLYCPCLSVLLKDRQTVMRAGFRPLWSAPESWASRYHKMSENQQHFCAKITFYQPQGVLTRKVAMTSWSSHSPRALPCVPARHQTTNSISSCKQIPAHCRRDPRAMLWSCVGSHTAPRGVSLSSQRPKCSWRPEISLHILRKNENRPDTFKTAPDGH